MIRYVWEGPYFRVVNSIPILNLAIWVTTPSFYRRKTL